MPKAIINGTLQPIRQRWTVSYDPERGQHISIPFESAGNGLAGLAKQLQALRIAYDFEPNATHSRLVAHPSGPQLGIPDVTCDTWQIAANEIQKDVKEAPAYASLTSEQLRAVQDAADDASKPFTTSDPYMADLYDALLRGTQTFSLSQYVLMHTTNVSNFFDGNIADVNIGRTYTTAQLLAEVTNPNLWVFPLPGRLIAKINAIEVPAVHSGYIWGWRKLASQEHTTSDNRIDIRTEYWLEQWRMSLYPPL